MKEEWLENVIRDISQQSKQYQMIEKTLKDKINYDKLVELKENVNNMKVDVEELEKKVNKQIEEYKNFEKTIENLKQNEQKVEFDMVQKVKVQMERMNIQQDQFINSVFQNKKKTDVLIKYLLENIQKDIYYRSSYKDLINILDIYQQKENKVFQK